ncbi:hypothetical protein JNUCC64_12055 [Streptomyces sp. JNUCC 64]
MIRDALLNDPPTETGAHCYVCGRWTTAPVILGHTTHHDPTNTTTESTTHHTCPHHITTPTTPHQAPHPTN